VIRQYADYILCIARRVLTTGKRCVAVKIIRQRMKKSMSKNSLSFRAFFDSSVNGTCGVLLAAPTACGSPRHLRHARFFAAKLSSLVRRTAHERQGYPQDSCTPRACAKPMGPEK
jgi:hypothetical protein